MIGVGAIGKQVATLLAAMGASRMALIDHDVVGEENLAVQGYLPSDIGKPKVEALKASLLAINPENLMVRILQNKFSRGSTNIMSASTETVVFCCVDSIEARKFIWENIRQGANSDTIGMWIDGRMAAETLRVLTWQKGQDTTEYDKTLFSAKEAFQAPCTGRSTLYSSYVAAGLMVGEFVKHLRNQDAAVVKDQLFNMLASELHVAA